MKEKNRVLTINAVLAILFWSLVLSFLCASVAFSKDLFTVTVKKGIMFDDYIKVESIQDPDMPFITIYLTSIKSEGKISDPSNNSLATRLTGKVGRIVKTKNMEVLKRSKSVWAKKLRVARYYDAKNNTLVYVSFSRKFRSGSFKHSLSVVPLGVK